MGKYNIHAGHCPQGKGASGAVGILKESIEDRLVKDRLITLLRNAGNIVYDCTDDTNCDQRTNLQRIVSKCNAHGVDYDISIHLNSGRNDYGGDGSIGGVEVYCYDNKTVKIAKSIVDAIADEFGYPKRSDGTTEYAGVKIRKNLYVLRHTNSPALLIECCFVDDKDDANVWNAERCANAIYKGITGESVTTKDGWILTDSGWWYKHKDGTYTTNAWEQINGTWYYFDENGYMKTGWIYADGNYFYANSSGAMLTGWQHIDDNWYYFDENGYMLVGWQKISDYWYYFNEEHDGAFGAMKTGWVHVNDNYFYLDSAGSMYENSWHAEEENWYYLKENGYMAHDEVVQIADELYYFMSDGRMARTDERGALR